MHPLDKVGSHHCVTQDTVEAGKDGDLQFFFGQHGWHLKKKFAWQPTVGITGNQTHSRCSNIMFVHNNQFGKACA